MSKPEADLFFLPTDALGGAERVMNLLVRETASTGRNVHVVILSRGDRGNWKNLPPTVTMHYVRANSEKTGLLPALRTITALSRQLDIRRVFSTHTHINAFLGLLRRFRLLRCTWHVARESTSMLDRFTSLKLASIRLLYQLGYGGQDLIICQTEYMKRRLLDFIPRAADWPMVVLPNPVDAEGARRRAAEPLAPVLNAWAPYVVTVGRLIHVKGVDVLIRAFARLKERHPGLRLAIVGDGPLRAELEALTASLHLSDSIRFCGHLENPCPPLAGADLAVVSSRIEGFPNTLLEAMSVCDRVVCTRCAGGIEAIPGIHTCVPDDAEALAAAMNEALVNPPTTDVMRAAVGERTPASFLRRVQSLLTDGTQTAGASA